MTVQENHDLADSLVLGQDLGDAPGPNRTNALDLAQPIRHRLDDVEDSRRTP